MCVTHWHYLCIYFYFSVCIFQFSQWDVIIKQAMMWSNFPQYMLSKYLLNEVKCFPQNKCLYPINLAYFICMISSKIDNLLWKRILHFLKADLFDFYIVLKRRWTWGPLTKLYLKFLRIILVMNLKLYLRTHLKEGDLVDKNSRLLISSRHHNGSILSCPRCP